MATDIRASSYPADRKRRKLRVAIITENFLPKVDGVTRTLARLLDHLNAEGHDAIVLGPETGVREYAMHPVVGTFGVPLIVYPGLKLNFSRPRFIRRLQQFKPDVCHFVDPIWLGAQMLFVVQRWMPEVPCVSSYHTNLPTYATLFGMPWLESTMWSLSRNLHSKCEMVFCPSNSTRAMLEEKGFKNVKIWSRGVDTTMFNPQARDDNLRASWGCSPVAADGKPQQGQGAIQLAQKLGLSPKASVRSSTTSPNFGPEDESFIRTPPIGPVSPLSTPHFSPPPAYTSLNDIPDLAGGTAFALPPPVLPQPFVHRYESMDASAGQGKTVLLYVGRISWEKNIRLLIEAFRQLPTPVRSKAKLVVVGDGPARADLTRLCNKLGLDATFMGHQKGTRLAAMYASSDISAFPSHTETFGQVVLEALACGLPVVGLHAQGTSDLVTPGRTGLLLDVAKAAKAGVSGSAPSTLSSRRASGDSFNGKLASDASTSPLALTPRSRPPYDRRSSSLKPARNAPGLATPIPTAADFAAAMSPGTSAFTACARSYSMHLERLIRDQPLRAAMGRQAQAEASRKTWWDAMDAVVLGYETVIEKRASSNLSDEELERMRDRQCKTAPLTGVWVRVSIMLYLLAFVLFWRYMVG
ncbi:UDP-Glycosyltransferase/glycogen phosphorylase [Microstroma glucosiphilum]|uniref:UDP-Glycosyltransferase/glycogen phosphorylase n=1 Tax=Pseudomicrostroma glucosiphilum TaxID=1684307 RepID=A0A316UC68_9BASI|nr:UDP-Glycosyltransferase/glycogen phosphorylase [Pseudomicrostroma glucosiphilum]PWN22769.1 UDP-Glycosyltransferase/glycogen phosphorylase [Pseudomicrostroma glucosiphilum]